jgi:hypothetical protein
MKCIIKNDERHTEQRWDQEQQATQEIFSHSMPVLGRDEKSLIIVTLPSYQGIHRWSVATLPKYQWVSILL